MNEIEFTLNYLPKRPNEIIKSSRKNWTKIYQEKERLQKMMEPFLIGKIPSEPWTRCKLLLVRQSFVCPDYDGLVSSFKYVIDLLTKKHFGLIVDDNYGVTGQWEVLWAKAPQKKGKIYVKVMRVDEK